MNFMRYKLLFFTISALFLVPGIYSLIRWGLKPSIDFTGGSVIEVQGDQLKDLSSEKKSKINEELSEVEALELNSIQQSGEKSLILKLKPIDKTQKEAIINKLKQDFGEVEEVRFEIVGPTIGKELIRKTIIAIILAAGFILVYVTFRFKDKKFGICAILAMFHDTLIVLGTFSLLGHFFDVEIDTLFVTAVLTILSFSVHDTVVVYDRIRESAKLNPKSNFVDLVNKAILETMNRSVVNSMTIIFMLLCLWLFGGTTIRWFVFALLIGTISGTYSSTFTAVPLLVLWTKPRKAAPGSAS